MLYWTIEPSLCPFQRKTLYEIDKDLVNSKDDESFDEKVEKYVYAYSNILRSISGNIVEENVINPDYAIWGRAIWGRTFFGIILSDQN